MMVKVAFASDNRQQVNQHFGVAQAFVCYEVTTNYAHLVEVIELTKTNRDVNEEKLASRIALLEGCAAIYCQAIGGSAIGQLLACGIQPLQVEHGITINNLLAELQQHLNNNTPPAWLIKYKKRQEAKKIDRFITLEAEGWQE